MQQSQAGTVPSTIVQMQGALNVMIGRNEMAQKRSRHPKSAGRKNQRVVNPIEKRRPKNQTLGGADPDNYPDGEPLSPGEAPMHAMTQPSAAMPMGVDVGENISGNPAATPNANAGGPSSTENIGDTAAELEDKDR
jgi:hypothetical protein